MCDYITLSGRTTDPFWTAPGLSKRIRQQKKDLKRWIIVQYIELMPGISKAEIARKLGISIGTLNRLIKENETNKRWKL